MRTLTALFCFCLTALPVTGEDLVASQLAALQEQLNKLNQKVETQQKTIEQQQKVIQNYQSAGKPVGTSPGARLLERLEPAEPKPAHTHKHEEHSSQVHVGGAVDTAFRYYSGANRKSDGRAAGNDFQLRSAHLELEGEVDDLFRGYMVLSGSDDAAHANAEAAVSVEEAAIETTSLPFVTAKGGRFFVPFGRLSSSHTHDLPFVDRPRSLEKFVGGESQGDGIQVGALLPTTHFWKITAGAFNKVGAEYAQRNGVNLDSTNPVNNRRSTAELTYFGKLLTRFNAGTDHRFEMGVSTLQVPDRKIRRNLMNLEFTYTWQPAGKERLVWGTELMRNQEALRTTRNYAFNYAVSDEEGNPVDADGDGIQDIAHDGSRPVFKRRSRTNFGGYSFVQYNLSKHWSLGARFDFSRDYGEFAARQPSAAFGEDGQPWLAADGSTQSYLKRTSKGGYDSTASVFVTYNFSEFSRLRFQANRHQYGDKEFANELLLQWTVFLGHHED
jgi:hypothetical protein